MRRVFGWFALGALVCACAGQRGAEASTPGGAQSPQRPADGAPAHTTDPGATADSQPDQSEPVAAPAVDAGGSGMHEVAADAGQAHGEGTAGDAADPALPPDLAHTFPQLTIAAGEEQIGVCQSWTLGNDAPLYVNRVVEHNSGSFHHSNWIWVDDASYDGPDGTWPCDERGFEQILAGAIGGVFFGQSTQALNDTQAFPAGVAFEMPAHARIIGDVHLLNPASDAIETSLSFELYTLPAERVQVKLQPMAFTNTALDIAAATDTHARMECATPQPDFDVYYVLPHYHSMGLGMRIDVLGGAMDGTALFMNEGGFGESVGQTFDPPLSVRGADGLAITCEYRNPRDTAVGYGEGDQEMCVTLIYSTGAKAGGTALTNFSIEDTGGVHDTSALCVAVGTP